MGLLAMTLLAAGCGGMSPPRGPAVTSYPVDEHWTAARYDTEIDTLLFLLPAAVGQVHWAVLSTTDEVTRFEARAITPADLPVHIEAEPVAEGTVEVRVKVGRFPHPGQAERLLQAFSDQLHAYRQRRARE